MKRTPIPQKPTFLCLRTSHDKRIDADYGVHRQNRLVSPAPSSQWHLADVPQLHGAAAVTNWVGPTLRLLLPPPHFPLRPSSTIVTVIQVCGVQIGRRLGFSLATTTFMIHHSERGRISGSFVRSHARNELRMLKKHTK
jgi:hypothetical protein